MEEGASLEMVEAKQSCTLLMLKHLITVDCAVLKRSSLGRFVLQGSDANTNP
jgi:hypothetical protein